MFEIYYTHEGTDYKVSPFDVTEDLGWRNVLGNPCASMQLLLITEKGYQDVVSGQYDIVINQDVAYATITSSNGIVFNNPIGIVTSAGNVNKILPGLKITLDTSQQYLMRFVVGGIWLENELRWIHPLVWRSVLGAISTSTCLKIKNNYGSTLHNCYVNILNKVKITQAMGTPIYSIYQTGRLNPLEQSAQAITFSSGQMLVAGIGQDMFDDADTLYSEGKGVPLNNTTPLVFGDLSNFQGINIILSSDVTNASTASLAVDPGSFVWQVSDDETLWNTEVNLGDMTNNQEILIYLRCTPPTNIDSGFVQGLLQLTADEGSFSTTLVAELLDVPDTSLDPSLIFRCSVLPQAMIDKLYEFGISEAS